VAALIFWPVEGQVTGSSRETYRPIHSGEGAFTAASISAAKLWCIRSSTQPTDAVTFNDQRAVSKAIMIDPVNGISPPMATCRSP